MRSDLVIPDGPLVHPLVVVDAVRGVVPQRVDGRAVEVLDDFRSGLSQVLHQRVLLVARRAVGAQLRVRVVLERRQLHAEVLQVRTARDDVRVVLLST